MKKIVSIIIAMFMLASLMLPNFVSAVETDNCDYSNIKQMLLDMGMSSYFVERMSNEQLELIASAQSVQCEVQYIPIDNNVGDDSASPCVAPILPDTPIDPDEPISRPTYHNIMMDDYMKLFLMVIKTSDYNYLMSIDAEWLTMPQNYLTDLIGICASKLEVVNSSRSGWFDYELLYDDGDLITYSYDFPVNSFVNKGINGGWNGSCATFDLFDIIDENRYYNNDLVGMYAHYEFIMTSGSTEELGAINVTGTYDHMVRSFGFEDNISVGTDGIGYSFSFLGLEYYHERDVSLPEPINYIPA